jgi:hypothetical protein
MAKDELKILYPADETLDTSIGEITVTRFKLKQLAQAGEVIARLMACIEFDKISNLAETIKIDPQWLGQALFGRGMESLMILLELGTEKTSEELSELEVDEAMELCEMVTRICLMPSIESAGKSLRKIKDSPKLGGTSSSDSPKTESQSTKQAA